MTNVRVGSKADIAAPPTDVRFTPKSGHRNSAAQCPLCAKSGHRLEFSRRLIDGTPSRDALILTSVIKRRQYRIYFPPLGRIWVHVVQIIY